MKKYVFTFIIALMVLLAVSLGFKIPKAQAAEVHISACGLLSQANTTYILDQDVSATGTCFTITATGIVLDLNGKTINFDTASSGTNGLSGVTIGDASHWVNLDDNGFKLKNGKIVQQGTSTYSYAIYIYNTNPRNVELSGLDVSVRGNSSTSVNERGTINLSIHDNIFRSSVAAIGNRMAYDGYALQVQQGQNYDIHDNKIIGGHGGIAFNTTAPNSRVYRNDINHKAVDSNGFGVALYKPHSTKVYENYIHTTDGLGILVDNEVQDVEVYSNTINVQMGPKSEYGSGYFAWGIKCRIPPGTNSYNLKVHDNDITTQTGDGLVDQAAGIGIYDGPSNLNNEFYNNNIKAIITPSTKPKYAYGIAVAGYVAANTGSKIYNNTITSNNINIQFSTYDGQGADGLVFSSNTLIKGDSPINYHTIGEGFSNYAAKNEIFIDTKVLNGADVHDIVQTSQSGGGTYSLYFKWYLDTLVKDNAGNAVSGATVSAVAKGGGTESPTATTDSSGRARLELTEYFQQGNVLGGTTPTKTSYTPHDITVSKSSLPTFTLPSLNMTNSKEMTIVLGATNQAPIISNVIAAVDSAAKTATIIWQTDKASDSKVDYGETTNYGQTKTDATSTTNHSLQLTGLVAPLYHFRVFSKDSSGESGGADHIFILPGGTTPTITLSKSVDKTQAASGDTLTYTLSYTNGSQAVTNTRIEDPIPTGTTYVIGSATNNGTYDQPNNKVIWNLGNLAAGASGNMTFQVRVQ